MKVLIFGNMGYVGPVVTSHFRKRFPDAHMVGCDSGFFAACLTENNLFPEVNLDEQYFRDVRQITPDVFTGADVVIQLAALSNDPLGNEFERHTHEINVSSTLKIAKMAKTAGVKNFVFASSCSVYGTGGSNLKSEDDELAPQTAYAVSKIESEKNLKEMACDDFLVTCLRFATACGFSPRLRLDLVLNDFVASALSSNNIQILSNGSPWRPLIHVRDMARAMEWGALRAKDNGGKFVSVNTGSSDWNYKIADLAKAVSSELKGVSVSINEKASPDTRSYCVDFSLFRALAPDHQPRIELPAAVRELADGLSNLGFADKEFRSGPLMRLNHLKNLVASGQINQDLYWQSRPEAAAGKMR